MTEQDDPPASPDRKTRQRIAKVMARAGLCSRRDAETWIVEGRVSVNGVVLTSPAIDVAPDDAILIDGAPLPLAERTRLFLFHKPRGLVTSDRDPEGRETVIDFLRAQWPEGPRVVTVGRLDINTEGLLLLTNDGGLARVLELPQTGWVRRYRVRAKGNANPATLDALAAGLSIDGIDYAGIEAKLDRVQGANCWLTMGLREGKNREIKRVLEHIGLEVNRLIRISYGPFQLLDLSEGAVEEVRSRVLRDQLGVKLAAQAGVTFDTTDATSQHEDGTTPHARAATPSPERKPRPQANGRPDRTSSSHRPLRPRPDGRDDRRATRNDEREKGAPPKRERPLTGTRKHVSRLRAADADAARTGPRKRIERSDTQDRRARTVQVERLIPTRNKGDVPRRQRGRQSDPSADPYHGRFGDERHETRRSASGRRAPPNRDGGRGDERPTRRQNRPEGRSDTRRNAAASAPRRHASPSALGKRERMSRSGGPQERRQEDRRDNDERSRHEAARSHRPQAPADAGGRQARRERAQVARPGSDKRARQPPRAFAERHPDRERPASSTDAQRDDRQARHGKRASGRGRGGALGRPTGAASRKPNARKPDAHRPGRPKPPAGPGGRPPRGTKPKR